MAKALVARAYSHGIIAKDDIEMYEYAVSCFLFSLLTWIPFVVVGVATRKLLGVLLFAAADVPLRLYAGGVHSKTNVRCFFISLAILSSLFGFLLLRDIMIVSSVSVFASALLCVVVFILSPVESINKPLSDNEKKHHGKVARFICALVLICTFVLFFAFRQLVLAYFLSMAINVVAMQLILGKIKNSFNRD